MSNNFIDNIENQELMNKLIQAGYGEQIKILLENEDKWTTKKQRLNKSGACRILKCKPKELQQLLAKWQEILKEDMQN